MRLLRTASVAAACVITLLAAQSAQAQTYSVLYSFKGSPDGGTPFAGVILDTKGNLYGTTYAGGASSDGTVFEVSKTGKETALYSFDYTDGTNPTGGLIRDAEGNLYGTTYGGGASGGGTVFELSKTGKETVLYSFKGGTDGVNPFAGVIMDANGNLYGTIYYGGAHSAGTIFEVSKTRKETVLYSFGGVDGKNPMAGVIRDARGNLYGTTLYGGTGCNGLGCGVVFKLSKTGKETVLYAFTGGTDGSEPEGGLIQDAKGNLYGTTSIGGASGWGTVFQVTKTGTETVLYSFMGGTDGSHPTAGVIQDKAGNFYGTTYYAHGPGTVFELSKAGNKTVLYSFTGGTDGGYPQAGVIRDSKGNLYGTTAFDGSSQVGVVYKLTP
jgi:uncharacterized repeat protein (TIGR03803 family)